MGTYTKHDQDAARAMLRKWLKPGDVVFTSLKHVSASGMRRVIQLHVFRGGSRNPRHLVLGYNAAQLLGYRYDREREGIVIDGVGMDMGFAIVYDLSRVLFSDGYKLRHEWI